MTFAITPMTMEDADKAYEIEAVSFNTPWSKDTFIKTMNNPLTHAFAAKAEGEILGYGFVMIVLDEAHILNIATHPEYRKKGVGKALMGEMLDFAKGKNASFALLEVRKSNNAAIKLYENFGFVIIDERKGYYQDNNEDALIMLLNF